MSEVRASADRELRAAPGAVFEFLTDYRERRPRILTDNYRDYRVEEGGVGAGTVIEYRFAAGRRERDYRLRVEVPEPGRTLRERDERSSFVTTWTVEPAAAGGSRVAIASAWQGAGGIGGFFERTFAPAGLRRIYGDVLERLERALTQA
jgi:hypothetical protein